MSAVVVGPRGAMVDESKPAEMATARAAASRTGASAANRRTKAVRMERQRARLQGGPWDSSVHTVAFPDA